MKDQVRFFSALSSEARIRILLLLKEHPQCVKTIAHRLKMSQPAVSQHLRVLKEAKLLRAKKTGYWMHYELDVSALESHGKALSHLFGGWIRPRTIGNGTAHCPKELLTECGAASLQSREERKVKEVKTNA